MTEHRLTSEIESLHRSSLLEGLDRLRKSDTFTDVTLLVDGVVFKAHRVVLASSSHYFRAMFADEMLEARSGVARITGVTSSGMSVLLDYIYTSRLDLTVENVQEVLATAVYTQVPTVVRACTEFLKVNLDADNCTDVAIVAEDYSLKDLREHVLRFIGASFLEVVESREFYRLSPEQMEYVVKGETSYDVPELTFLRHVLRWFLEGDDAAVERKQKYAVDILSHVKFHEIIPSQLRTLLENLFAEYKLARINHPLHETVLRLSHLPENLLRLPLKSYSTRGMQLAVVKIGGFGMKGLTNDITYSYVDERQWRHLTVIPHVEQCNYGAAVLGNELYIIGGCFNQSLQEDIHPFGFRYKPQTNTWRKIRSMKVERCRFTLTNVGDKLYAVAGATEVENSLETESTQTVERYDADDDAWTFAQSLPESRQQHAAASLSHLGRDMLFVSGGLHKDQVIASMFMYDVDRDAWTSCAPLLTPRADHFMISYGHRLYVCGGWREDPENPERRRIQVTTVDAYDVFTNTWTHVTNVPGPRYHPGVVAHDSKIYFIGGFQNDATFHKDTAPIECYDIATDTWTKGEKNRQDFWEHTCVMLYVPINASK